jgi:hypothetical protein
MQKMLQQTLRQRNSCFSSIQRKADRPILVRSSRELKPHFVKCVALTLYLSVDFISDQGGGHNNLQSAPSFRHISRRKSLSANQTQLLDPIAPGSYRKSTAPFPFGTTSTIKFPERPQLKAQAIAAIRPQLLEGLSE